MTADTKQPKKNIIEMFVDGAKRGFTIGTTAMLPNVIMAFIVIKGLEVTGLLTIIGKVFAPVMAMWGLPGAAAAALVAAFMSMGGGVGVVASLYVAGALSAQDVTVLAPAIYLLGNPAQNMGRCPGIAEVNPKHFAPILAICITNCLLSIWFMQGILLFFKK